MSEVIQYSIVPLSEVPKRSGSKFTHLIQAALEMKSNEALEVNRIVVGDYGVRRSRMRYTKRSLAYRLQAMNVADRLHVQVRGLRLFLVKATK
jgi:hypothetical protein